MNLKATCVLVNIVAAAVPCTFAAGDQGTSTFVVPAGGQAAPPAAGGAGFVVRVAKGLDEAAAKSLQQDLVNEGFTAAAARPAGDGKHEVVIPGMSSRAQADGVVNELKSSGYTTSVEVVTEGGGSAGPVEANGQTIYRVKVAEFDTEAQAIEASKVLVDEGFVNVDVTQENNKHLLMLGTFNKESEAQALLGDVNRAGFALASVVSKERLRPDTGQTADVSALPANEQGRAREILEMAQKVERGEASADEVKRLREMVQQMTSTQRQVLNQQESSRAATQDKNQQIYDLYRQFDKAISAQDYTRAEQILNQVRQIDPDDIFLSGRVATLENQRSGGAGAAGAAPSGRPDPAKVQSLINEARAAETAGNPSLAADKYNQVLALDPSNTAARTKIAQLNEETAGGSGDAAGGLLENKTLLYAIGGAVLAIIALLIWMKSRGGKAAPKEPTPATGTNFGSPDYSSTLGGGMDMSGSATPTPAGGLSTGMAGGLAGVGLAGGVPDYSPEESADEEEPDTTPAPASPGTATQVMPESDMVSPDDFEDAPAETSPAATSTPAEDEVVSLNFDEEVQAAPAESKPTAASPSGGAMDADLEALLQGTFAGAEGTGAVAAAGAAAAGAGAGESQEPRVVYAQDFDNLSAGSPADGWRGEYDYAALTIDDLGDNHNRCLKYSKPEGSGSATYHLEFPKASGRVIAEFDLRCDEKNKFLLGVYLEHEEDFKQSIHTIVHQLDPSAPASLRIQGEAAPYAMGEWRHIRYEIDLPNARLDAYMDGEHVVEGAELAVVPEYVNTLSIRDNLATTGTLYLDNITITEA